jgi:hypothetical protein
VYGRDDQGCSWLQNGPETFTARLFLPLLNLRVIDEVCGPTFLRERIPTYDVPEHKDLNMLGARLLYLFHAHTPPE